MKMAATVMVRRRTVRGVRSWCVLVFAACAVGGCVPAPVIRTAFSPGSGADTAEALVLDVIAQAQHTLELAAYGFTSKTIAAALVDAEKRGVVVRAVMDDSNTSASRYSGAQFLANEGVEVRIDRRYAIFHHKFLVIDGQVVQTGSFNYTTAAASRNAENVIVISGAPDTAATYAKEWQRLWEESEALAAR